MAAERTDLFDSTCYTGEHPRLQSPEVFRKQFCAVCRNPACTNSIIGQSRWQTRVDTQEEKLLVNPQFGDPNDPRFFEIAGQAFEDRLREVMAIEIASQKNDWEPVTDTEVDAALGTLPKKTGLIPAGFLERSTPPDPPVMLWEGQARGTGGSLYRLTLLRLGTGEEVWSCTCPAFQNRGGRCKHIQEAIVVRAQTEAPIPEVPATPDPNKPVNTTPASPEKWQQAMDKRRLPQAKNTAFPASGMMIDGSAPTPPPDPWAPAAPIVPVGGRVVLGGPKKEGT